MTVSRSTCKPEAPDERVKTLPNTAIQERSSLKMWNEQRTKKVVINEMKNDYFFDVTLRVSFHGDFEPFLSHG